MQLIDSHCHLDLMQATETELADYIANASANHVVELLNISVNLSSYPQVLQTAKRFEQVWASVGIHPCYEKEAETTVEELCLLAKDDKVLAIGETGLDYHMNRGCDPRGEDFVWQRERFATHIQAAIKAKKPLIVHTRDAIKDTMTLMQQQNAEQIGGVMHCYVEDLANAQLAMEMNFMISFSGIVSFKNAKELHEVAKAIPDEYLLIETDSPYLAPMPYRGKKNQPAYVFHVAEALAKLRNTSVEHIAKISTENFRRLMMK